MLHNKILGRKVKEETSLIANKLSLIGYYEDTNELNPFGEDFKSHSVSIVFLTTISNFSVINLDNQSSDWKFSKELPKTLMIHKL